jgi:hypothetical protein
MKLNSNTWLSEWSKYAVLFSGIVNMAAMLLFGNNSCLFFVIFHCVFTFYGVYLIYDLLRWGDVAFFEKVYRHYDVNSWVEVDKTCWMKRKWGVFEL